MEKMDIGIIGSGAMGSGIAQVALQHGHKVFLHDNNPQAVEKALSLIQANLEKLQSKGKISAEEISSCKNRLFAAGELSALKTCGLVIEAIVEVLDVKKKVFSSLEEVLGDHAVLATNTSSLSVTSIASACKDPSRVIGIHFFNPAPLMPLVEIIPGIRTRQELLPEIRSLISSWSKIPVIAKDTPGFIVNRVARPYYGEAIRIYEEGIADFATIDYAMRETGGFRMGPFELMDFIGNDVNYRVTEAVWEQFFYEPRFKPSFTQKRLFEAGMYGRKTGSGYYQYEGNASMPEPDKDPVLGNKIFMRIISMLINEAYDSLLLGLASREDIETAMTKGVNYPKGLLAWSEELGVEKVYNQMKELFLEYGEDRYRPSAMLKRLALEKTRIS